MTDIKAISLKGKEQNEWMNEWMNLNGLYSNHTAVTFPRSVVLWVATGYWEPRSLYLHTQVIVCVPLRIWQHCLVWYTRCLVYPQITSVAGFHFNQSGATPDSHCIICLSLPSVIIRCGSCWSGIQDWSHTGCSQIRMITPDFKNKLWDHIHS